MSAYRTIVDLMRHGEPVGGRRIRGQCDDPLSERGWAQMRAAVEGVAGWQAIASSTLSRCARFAEELAERQRIPLELDPRLQERGYGAWEGRAHEEIDSADPGALARLRADPLRFLPPEAEPLERFRTRVITAWNELLVRHAGKRWLLVGHAGVIRVIVGELLGMPLAHLFRLDVPNAGLTRVQIDGRGAEAVPRLVFHAGRL